jgi:hypothetical protein
MLVPFLLFQQGIIPKLSNKWGKKEKFMDMIY